MTIFCAFASCSPTGLRVPRPASCVLQGGSFLKLSSAAPPDQEIGKAESDQQDGGDMECEGSDRAQGTFRSIPPEGTRAVLASLTHGTFRRFSSPCICPGWTRAVLTALIHDVRLHGHAAALAHSAA